MNTYDDDRYDNAVNEIDRLRAELDDYRASMDNYSKWLRAERAAIDRVRELCDGPLERGCICVSCVVLRALEPSDGGSE